MNRVKIALRTPWFWAIVGIVLLLVINSVKDPTYLAVGVNPTTGLLTGNLLDILRISAPIIMIALGMTFVIATGGIDLSVGSMMAVGGAVAMETLSSLDGAAPVGAMLTAKRSTPPGRASATPVGTPPDEKYPARPISAAWMFTAVSLSV